LNSLNIVSNELIATVEQCAGLLETFVSDRKNLGALAGCAAGIKQLDGALRLIELTGADLLTDGLSLAAQFLMDNPNSEIDDLLQSMTDAFFVLPRYVEYVSRRKSGMPVLLTPYTNALRTHIKKPLLDDSHFMSLDVSEFLIADGNEMALLDNALILQLKRLRHMYQVGLLNVLQGKATKAGLGLMARSLERLEVIAAGCQVVSLWAVGAKAISVLAAEDMELTRQRKLLVASLDRQIKVFQGGLNPMGQPVAKSQLANLAYIVALAEYKDPKASELLNSFHVEALGYNHRELMCEQERMQEPSIANMATVSSLLRNELQVAKRFIDGAALVSSDFNIEGGLADVLTSIADILSVVRLQEASRELKMLILRINDTGSQEAGNELMEEIANTLLYIESVVVGVGDMDLSSDKLTQINSITRHEFVVASYLAEAESLVLQEAESGLELIKSSLSAFMQSGFDPAHIRNLNATLHSVRGAAVLLGLSRATQVLVCCVKFIDAMVVETDGNMDLKDVLETFADVVISLEYYLGSLRAGDQSSDSILEVAEEALEILGFPSNHSFNPSLIKE
jgi:hypothetical protein